MKRAYVSGYSKRSGEGWRLTYFNAQREPVLSLWGPEPLELVNEAHRHFSSQAGDAQGLMGERP